MIDSSYTDLDQQILLNAVNFFESFKEFQSIIRSEASIDQNQNLTEQEIESKIQEYKVKIKDYKKMQAYYDKFYGINRIIIDKYMQANDLNLKYCKSCEKNVSFIQKLHCKICSICRIVLN